MLDFISGSQNGPDILWKKRKRWRLGWIPLKRSKFLCSQPEQQSRSGGGKDLMDLVASIEAEAANFRTALAKEG